MILNNQIKLYRQAAGLTQEQLAEKMYLSRQSISKWENGESYPSIDNLILLSDILSIPLDNLVKEKLNFPTPFDFGKPKSKKPLFVASFFPCLLFIAALLEKGDLSLRLIPFFAGIFSIGIIRSLTPFDFKRYYSYFTVHRQGIEVDTTTGKLSSIKILKSLFGKRSTKFIPLKSIQSITIHFDTSGYQGSDGMDYRPRQMYLVRESFFMTLKTNENDIYTLDLDSVYYPSSKENQYFYSICCYLYKNDIKIMDPYKILESIHHEYEFIEEAYKLKKES